MREYALVLLVAAGVTFLLTPVVRRVAIATNAMHEPRARDTHTKATPLLGGLAMYGGLVAGLVLASRLSFVQDPFQAQGSRTEAGLLLAGGFIVIVGFVDDRWGLSAISKLAGQVAAAGILVWSGASLPWLPLPSGGVFSLEPDLSVVLTIGVIVVTINAINFIDGLDGLAAGIVAVAALSFLAYSYTLIRTIGNTSQSLPAVVSALLAGMCLGFLPHNFYPARIFMGDIGAMLLGLLLAYGPIASTDSLAPALLTNYGDNHPLDRFPTFLPLLVPAAIFIIPYADLMFAIIRRAKAGKPLMAADRQHLHHRVMNIGHSYRQSVLIMYLWAALFSVAVVSLSLDRSPSIVFALATLVAVLALLPVTMPRLRPWRILAARRAAAQVRKPAASAAQPLAPAGLSPGYDRATGASPLGSDPLPRAGRLPTSGSFPAPPPGTNPQHPPAAFTATQPQPIQPHSNGNGSHHPGRDPFPAQDPFPGLDSFQPQEPPPGQAAFPHPAASAGTGPHAGLGEFTGPLHTDEAGPFPVTSPFGTPVPPRPPAPDAPHWWPAPNGNYEPLPEPDPGNGPAPSRQPANSPDSAAAEDR